MKQELFPERHVSVRMPSVNHVISSWMAASLMCMFVDLLSRQVEPHSSLSSAGRAKLDAAPDLLLSYE